MAEVLNLAGNLAAYFGGPALFPGLACHVIAGREENKNWQHHSAMVSTCAAMTGPNSKKIHRSRNTAVMRGGDFLVTCPWLERGLQLG